MLKKLFLIFPLYIAFGLVMAHSIIPHHHGHKKEVAGHHHHSHHHHHENDHHEQENKNNDLANGFASFQHAGYTTLFILPQFAHSKILNYFPVIIPLFSSFFEISLFESPPIPLCFSPPKTFFCFFYSPQTSLRAPPVSA